MPVLRVAHVCRLCPFARAQTEQAKPQREDLPEHLQGLMDVFDDDYDEVLHFLALIRLLDC
jgi:hypothetical protein